MEVQEGSCQGSCKQIEIIWREDWAAVFCSICTYTYYMFWFSILDVFNLVPIQGQYKIMQIYYKILVAANKMIAGGNCHNPVQSNLI